MSVSQKESSSIQGDLSWAGPAAGSPLTEGLHQSGILSPLSFGAPLFQVGSILDIFSVSSFLSMYHIVTNS